MSPEEKRMELLEKIAICVERSGEKLVLCGGMAAFLICESSKARASVVFTEDADLLIRRKRKAEKAFADAPVTVAKVMLEEGFKPKSVTIPMAENDRGLPGEHWLNGNIPDLYVEFLTEDNQKKKHKISGITAQGLSYFSMSLENSFLFTLPSGRKIDVVAPDAFIMHKALTFPLRRTYEKKMKDLYYISFVGQNAFSSTAQIKSDIGLLFMHNKWRKTAFSNMKGAVNNLAKDSTKIISNDISGILREEDLRKYLDSKLFEPIENIQAKIDSVSSNCTVCAKFYRVSTEEKKSKKFCLVCEAVPS